MILKCPKNIIGQGIRYKKYSDYGKHLSITKNCYNMKLSPKTILHLALMICGDDPYKGIFPYRTSSYLTTFFTNINLSYVHDSTTRKWWVQGVLNELNDRSSNNPEDPPSNEILKVIDAVIDPIEFPQEYFNFELSLEKLNTLLKPEGLHVSLDETTGKRSISFLQGAIFIDDGGTKHVKKVITICPEIFNIPENIVINSQVAVMMPFNSTFDRIYKVIVAASNTLNLDCFRGDNIWKNSEIIQDVFDLILSSKIVVVDVTGKNPNVFYELGIAHALGRKVVPISQNMEDVPFDIRHHRILLYKNTEDGMVDLNQLLIKRLKTLKESN
jgi:hypothetical protein